MPLILQLPRVVEKNKNFPKSNALSISQVIFIGLFAFFLNGICGAPADFLPSTFDFSRGQIVPLSRYVRLCLGEQILPVEKRIVLKKEEIQRLKVVFLRDSLQPKDGPQFLKLTSVVTRRTGVVLDENEQYAITFFQLGDSTKEIELLREYVYRVNPLGWFNPESIDWIPIQVDTLSPWGGIDHSNRNGKRHYEILRQDKK